MYAIDVLIKLVTLALVAIAMAIGGSYGLSEITHAGVEDFSRRVTNGLVVESSYWSKSGAVSAVDNWMVFPCGGRAMQARFIVALAKIDSFATSDDFDAKDKAITAALNQGRVLLRCAPMDAKSWLRLARVNLSQEGLSPATIAAFDLSDNLAPSEGWLMEMRLPVYADFVQRGVADFAGRVTRDARLFTAYGHDPLKALRWFEAWPQAMGAGFLAGLALAPHRERRWMEQVASSDGVDIGQGARVPSVPMPFSLSPFSEEIK